MTPRKYAIVDGFVGNKYTNGLKGQAKVVFNEINAIREPKLAKDITQSIVDQKILVTGQDPLRVVLYYLIIFKGKGIVRAIENDDENIVVDNPWRQLNWAPAE